MACTRMIKRITPELLKRCEYAVTLLPEPKKAAKVTRAVASNPSRAELPSSLSDSFPEFREHVQTWTRHEIVALETIMYIGRDKMRAQRFDEMWNRLLNTGRYTGPHGEAGNLHDMCSKTPLRQYLLDGLKRVKAVLLNEQ